MKILEKWQVTTRGSTTRGLFPLLAPLTRVILTLSVFFALTHDAKAWCPCEDENHWKSEFETVIFDNNFYSFGFDNNIFKPFKPSNNKKLLSYYYNPGRLIKRNRPYDYYYTPDKSYKKNKQYEYRVEERESHNNQKSISASWMRGKTPHFAIKTNIVNTFSSSLNLSSEFRMSKKATFNTSVSWNPWTFNAEENTKFKFLLVEPSVRFWSCESFNGHFFSIHGHYAYYNVGKLPVRPFTETLNQYRFEGQLAGAGISYGYHWLLAPRWSFDAEIGVGYARLWYGKYPCQSCAKILTNENKNYWGLTRAGFSIAYLF